MNTDHANIRDEQFWFTAATVAFNTVLIEHNVSQAHRTPVIVAAAVVSLFGAWLVLTRWLHGARGAPSDAPPGLERRNRTRTSSAHVARVHCRLTVAALCSV